MVGLKYFYMDSDGDIISVSNQSDLHEANQEFQGSQLRLFIAKDIEEAR